MAKKRRKSSTQKYLPVQEIRDGVIVLRDGGLRTILMVNAINFNLKSQQEKEALLNNYSDFLNGLDFPIQILTQSRKLDLEHYLDELENKARQQTNSLLKTQTDEYVKFVRELIGVANIMSKTFYVVVPYEAAPVSQGFFARLFGKSTPAAKGKRFEKLKEELLERTQVAASGLGSLGLNNVQLNTQEVIELLYSTYNPDIARRQKLFSISNVDISVIEKMQES